MSPEVVRRVVQLFQKFHPAESVDYRLSPTEMWLLKLLAEGQSLQGRCRGGSNQHQHSVVSHAAHLSEVTGALENRGAPKALRDRLIQ